MSNKSISVDYLKKRYMVISNDDLHAIKGGDFISDIFQSIFQRQNDVSDQQ